MAHLKKQFLTQKLYNILYKNNIISFFHYNNLNSKQWSLIKKDFSHCQPLQTLFLSNRNLLKHLENLNKNLSLDDKKTCFRKSIFFLNSNLDFKENQKQEKKFLSKGREVVLRIESQFQRFSKYLQGPTFVIGFQSSRQLHNFLDILKKNSHLYLLQIFFEQKSLSYLDLQKLIQLKKIENIHPAVKKQIYGQILDVLPKKKDIWLLVQQTLFIDFIQKLQLNIQLFFFMRKNISFFCLKPVPFYVVLLAYLQNDSR